MNFKTIEYGLNLSGCTYDQLLDKCEVSECEEFAMVDGREVETHPHRTNQIFVSYGELDHGEEFPPVPTSTKEATKKLTSLLPGVVATWGLILTER